MDDPPASVQTELRGLAFAADWPEHVIAGVAMLATSVTCQAGAVLFREGDRDDSIYFVSTGCIALEMAVPARGRIRLLTVSSGEVLGWSPLIGNPEMTATALALEATTLLRISGAELLSLCQRDHEIGFAVMHRVARALSRRLMATRLQLLDLFSHSAPEVIAARAGGER